MAVSTTFKQQCPSCEAMISVKESMIGKKVECTKCKDKFVAKKPVAEADDADELEVVDELDEVDDLEEVDDLDEVDEKPAKNGKAKTNGKPKPKEDELEEVDDLDEVDEKPAKNGKTPAKPKPKPAAKEDDLEEVDDLDEVDEKPAKNGKTPPKPAAKPRPKPAAKEDDLEEVDDLDEVDEKPAKNGKAKAKPPAKPRPAAKGGAADDEEDEEDAGESKKKDKKKLTIGLALAGVGVVILVIAAVFVLRSGGQNRGGVFKPGPGNNQPANPDQQDTKIPSKTDDRQPEVAVALTDAERVKLSNLLPGKSEHVFRANFKELFDPSSPIRAAAFESPGPLDDADLKKKLGFSILALDDLICAEKVTSPGWRFSVLHFKDVVKEGDLTKALKLKPVGKGIDGQAYFKMTDANPWFEQLARFSFGIPNAIRALDVPSDKPTYFRLHNAQTLIVADETPMLDFLKAKGEFPLLSTPTVPASTSTTGTPPITGGTPAPTPETPMPKPDGPGPKKRPMPKLKGAAAPAGRPEFTSFNDQGQPAPPGGGATKNPMDELRGSTWEGTEDTGSKIKLVFSSDANPTVKIDSDKRKLSGAGAAVTTDAAAMPPQVILKANGDPGSYELKLEQPTRLVGTYKSPADGSWPVTLERKTGPSPAPSDPKTAAPGAPPSAGDGYMTIKPALKAVMDRMENRGPDGKDKILLSSATDMDATWLDVKSPEFKYLAPRKGRQFWDVTLLLNENGRSRFRFLGTSLAQRDTLKFRLRNEITCGVEADASEITDQLNQRVSKSITRFIGQLVGHEVKIAAPPAPTPMPMPSPQPLPPGKEPEKKEEQKLAEPNESQIMVKQSFTTVDVTLDLMIDTATLNQIRAIARLNAGKVRLAMEAATVLSLRHQLAGAAREAGDKGLSQRQIQVPPGRLPPGAFERLRDPDTTKPAPLRVDREPKQRISFLAGLLPYIGQQSLLDSIKFEHSWRDPGNWLAGSTVVPQFLDPTYPERSRHVSFGDLPVDFAATHYVGIAGVGLDAASYKRGDPATQHKRGAFSYDQSASMSEISAGRGLSNTAIMIQVPHDAVTGVSPWIAGGGATLRGVPEKNSITPFLATTNAGKRGTYVLMADGSVRFVDQNVSDEVFKAMCTIEGPKPANFDLDNDPNTPLVPAPKDPKGVKEQKVPDLTPRVDKNPLPKEPEKTPPAKQPGLKEPEKTPAAEKKPVPKEPDNTRAPPDKKSAEESPKKIGDDKSAGPSPKNPGDPALEGTWRATSVLNNGKEPPPGSFGLGAKVVTFKGDEMSLFFGKVHCKIDTTKSPKQIEYAFPGDKGPRLGIYEVKGADLKICWGAPGQERPTAFASQPGSRWELEVYRKFDGKEK